MRLGFEGLSGLVAQVFDDDLSSGAYFVFLNRKRDRMKVLYWDGDGLALWYKRLEKGSFPRNSQEVLINRREFFMLLEGVIAQRYQKRYRLEKLEH